MKEPHLHIVLGKGGIVEFWYDATEYLKWCFGDAQSVKILLHTAEKETPLSIAVAHSVRRHILNSVADGGKYDISFIHCERINVTTKNGTLISIGK